jgi:hypothetical protein
MDGGTGELLKAFDDFIGLAWLSDGDTLIGLSISDSSLKAVSASSAKTLYTLDGFGPINGYSSSLFWDGDTLLTYNGIYQTRWNPANSQIVERHPTTSPPAWVSPDYAPISPDRRFIASPNMITEISSKRQLVQLDDHPTHDRDRVAGRPMGSDWFPVICLVWQIPLYGMLKQERSCSDCLSDTPGYNPYLGVSVVAQWKVDSGGGFIDEHGKWHG